MNVFEKHEIRMALAHDRVFGTVCTLQPMTTPVNGEPMSDPDRPLAAGLVAVWDIQDARVNAGDNGVGGSRPSGFRLGHAAQEVFASIRRGQLPYDLMKGDRLLRADRPGKIWIIAEIMPDGGARDRVRLNEVA
ncbi:hypothetical protein [Microvirga solisilvae]|uniref:hypothetical protein n=1 Tax=Microvirga solisilvae TaxID=2919498 RepID=UPI001FAE901F|nr:hypothetical protein [Microvirga solisilvae]